LVYLLIEIFSWDIVYENLILSVYWVSLDLFGPYGLLLYLCKLFWHPFDNRHNTTLFLEVTRSNLSWWWYFWKYFCLNFFKNMSANGSLHKVRQMDPLENRLLLKTYAQIQKVSGFSWGFSPQLMQSLP
jgi:hypothetical protein